MTSRPQIPLHNLQSQSDSLAGFKILEWDDTSHEYSFEEPHRHTFCEMLIFDKGGGTHDIDFTTYSIQSCSVHFVGSDNVHLVLRSKESSGCSLLFHTDYFDNDLFQQLPFNRANPVIQFSSQEFLLVQTLVDCIKKEYSEQPTGYDGIIRKLMEALMLYVLRGLETIFPLQTTNAFAQDLVSRFGQLVKQHYKQHYTVEQYARALNISAKHLIAECKAGTGKTPLQYISEYTVAEAKRMLFYSKLSVKEIAYELGFEEPSHFSKYFKRVTAYTPSIYRNNVR